MAGRCGGPSFEGKRAFKDSLLGFSART